MSATRPWFLLGSGPGPADLNMALDEALMEAAPRLGSPVLRFYAWTEPAASFGYFQKYAGVERATPLRPLVRRCTGGGIVPHDADWTYSIVFPADHEWYALNACESYRRVHEWLVHAFARLDIMTELATAARHAGAGQCFVGHEKFDVLRNGRKVAGAAQRRTRSGLLIQGSVQPPVSLGRKDWEAAVCETASMEMDVCWRQMEADGILLQRAAELCRLKYAQAAYNQRR